VSSLLTLLPDYGAAIIQLANSDNKFSTNQDIVEDIISAIPSIPAVYKPLPLASTPDRQVISTQRASLSEASLTTAHDLDLGQFVGTYSDAAYGNYTFCLPPKDRFPLHFGDDWCKQIHLAYSTVENVTALSKTKLYGYMRPLLFGYGYLTLTLLAQDGDRNILNLQSERTVTFELQYTAVFPKGYGTDTRPFEYGAYPGAGPRAVFSVKDGKARGFGLFGFAGQVLLREKRGKTVEGRAEVWFNRVETQ
jgi:hypothetical protein